MSRYLIVGGVAAGMSAAARLRRLDETAEIIVFERGEYISYANCGLPYYVGAVIRERDSLLLQTPHALGHRGLGETEGFRQPGVGETSVLLQLDQDPAIEVVHVIPLSAACRMISHSLRG